MKNLMPHDTSVFFKFYCKAFYTILFASYVKEHGTSRNSLLLNKSGIKFLRTTQVFRTFENTAISSCKVYSLLNYCFCRCQILIHSQN